MCRWGGMADLAAAFDPEGKSTGETSPRLPSIVHLAGNARARDPCMHLLAYELSQLGCPSTRRRRRTGRRTRLELSLDLRVGGVVRLLAGIAARRPHFAVGSGCRVSNHTIGGVLRHRKAQASLRPRRRLLSSLVGSRRPSSSCASVWLACQCGLQRAGSITCAGTGALASRRLRARCAHRRIVELLCIAAAAPPPQFRCAAALGAKRPQSLPPEASASAPIVTGAP